MSAQARARRVPDVEKAPLDTPYDTEPLYGDADADEQQKKRRDASFSLKVGGRPVLSLVLHPVLLGLATLAVIGYLNFPWPDSPLPSHVAEGIKRCEAIKRGPPNPKPDAKRETSDRFVKGTSPVWLKNATVWTGEKGGEEVLYGSSVWLEGGVIRKIGKKDGDFAELIAASKDKAEEVDLHGAWVTPGIVDLHSHLAVDPAPGLRGSDSTNSWKQSAQPWLRSLDGFNTHDAAFNLSISGGVTTMLVLPGSAGNIGGQAFTFKPRWTEENTPQSMQVEPPFKITENGTWERTGAWRHMKHACGENPLRVYGNTRMDSSWDFRRTYDSGRKLKEKQDAWCENPKEQKEAFPDDLTYEAVADIIRGNVKVNVHCYETVDLNDMVRISNEFQFPISSFHHAHEAYLVPELLKQTWGGTPGVAIFANNARYKREAYRGTPYAAKILADAGLTVVHKSDHPVLDSRHLIYEAAQSHAFGLNFSHALSSVTTHSAKIAGLDHRVGYVRPGYDADIVVWDSFPLAIGATPKQTYIDGIAQIVTPHVVEKPKAAQKISPAGDYAKEAAEAVASRGDPDLRPKHKSSAVVFDNVSGFYLRESGFDVQGVPGRVIVENGKVTCVGTDCATTASEYETVDLRGGSFLPGLISTGSKLGLIEIAQEESTWDGIAYDPLTTKGLYEGVLVRGSDGARFGGKDLLMAYKEGVTTGVSWPVTAHFVSGLAYSFSTSAEHPLEKGAIGHPGSALVLRFDNRAESVSTQIALLRKLLSGEGAKGELAEAFKRVADGELRLVVEVTQADQIAALIRAKRDVAPKAKITLFGAHEAWIVADDLAKEDIGVIVAKPRSFPESWDERRILPGPPLSNHTLPSYLTSKGVTVGLGILEECDARLTRFDAAWAYTDAPHVFSKQEAVNLVSGNLEELLGLRGEDAQSYDSGFVAYEGDFFSFEGRVRASRAPGADVMDLFL